MSALQVAPAAALARAKDDAAPAADPEVPASDDAAPSHFEAAELDSSPTIPSRKSSLTRAGQSPRLQSQSLADGSVDQRLAAKMIAMSDPQQAARLSSLGDYAFPAPPSRAETVGGQDSSDSPKQALMRKTSLDTRSQDSAEDFGQQVLPADGAGLGLAAVDDQDLDKIQDLSLVARDATNPPIGRDSAYVAANPIDSGKANPAAMWHPLPRFIRGLVIANFEPTISEPLASPSASTPMSARMPVSSSHSKRESRVGGGSFRRNRTRSTATITSRNSFDFSLPARVTRSEDQTASHDRATANHRRTGSQSSTVASANGVGVPAGGEATIKRHRRTGSQRSVGSEVTGTTGTAVVAPASTIFEEADVDEAESTANVFQQSLELGQEVYAFEHCETHGKTWYRGYVVAEAPIELRQLRNIWGQALPDLGCDPTTVSSTVFLGIFPAACIRPIEEVDDREGKLVRGSLRSKQKESPPLPMVVGSRGRSLQTDPFVEELGSVIKSCTARLPYYLEQRKYALFRSTSEHIQYLLQARQQLAKRLLTAVEAVDLRKACVLRIAQGAHEQELPQAAMHSDGRRAKTGPPESVEAGWVTPLRLRAMSLATTYLATSPATGSTSNPDDEKRSRIARLYLDDASTHLLSTSELKAASRTRHDLMTLSLEVKAIVGKLCAEGELLELVFSLHDSVARTSLTEDYIVVFNHLGVPVDSSRSKAAFRDLEAVRSSQFYLVVRAIRLVPYKRLAYSSRTAATWTSTYIRRVVGCGVNLVHLERPATAATEVAIALFQPRNKRDFASCHEDIIQGQVNGVRPIDNVKLVLATQTCDNDSPARTDVLPLMLTPQANARRPRDWIYLKFWQNTLPELNGDAHIGCTVELRDLRGKPIAQALHLGGTCNPSADSIVDPSLDGSLLAVPGKYVDHQPSTLFLTFFAIAQTGVNGEPEQRVWATASLALQDATTGNAIAEGTHRLHLENIDIGTGSSARRNSREHLDVRVQFSSSRLMSGFLNQLLNRESGGQSDSLRLLSFLDAKELALHADDILHRLLDFSISSEESQTMQLLDAVAATLLAQRQADDQASVQSHTLVSKAFAAATPLLDGTRLVLQTDVPERNRLIQVLPAILTLIVSSIQGLSQLPSSVIDHTVAEIRSGITNTLREVTRLLRLSDPSLLATQVLALENFPLQAISVVLPPDELSETIAGVCDAVRSKAGQKIIQAKYSLMQRCLELFSLQDQLRTELAPVFISHIKVQLEPRKESTEPLPETFSAINTLLRLSDVLTQAADVDTLEYLLSSTLLPILRYRSRLLSTPVSERNLRKLRDQQSFVGALFASTTAFELAIDEIDSFVWALDSYMGRQRMAQALETAWETSTESDTTLIILDFAKDGVRKSLTSTEADRQMIYGAATAILWCLTESTSHAGTKAEILQVIASMFRLDRMGRIQEDESRQNLLDVLHSILGSDGSHTVNTDRHWLGSVVRLATSDQDTLRSKAVDVVEAATATMPADEIRAEVIAEVMRLLSEKTIEQITALLFLLRAEFQRKPAIQACLGDRLDQIWQCLPASEDASSIFAIYFSLTDVINVLRSMDLWAAEAICLRSLRDLLRDEPINWAFAAWEEIEAQERVGRSATEDNDDDIPLRYAALNALVKADACASALRKSIELERLQEENGRASHRTRAQSLSFRSELHARMSSTAPRTRFYLVQFAEDVDCAPFVTMMDANKLVALLAASFEGLSIHLGAPSKNGAASCWVTSLEPLHAYLPEALSDPWSMTTNVKRFCYLLDAEDGTKIRHIFRTQHPLPYMVPFVRVVEQSLDELSAEEVACRQVLKDAREFEDGIRKALRTQDALHSLSAVLGSALDAPVIAAGPKGSVGEEALSKYALVIFKGLRIHRELSLETDMQRFHGELVKAFERKYSAMVDLDSAQDLHFAWEREPYLEVTQTGFGFRRRPAATSKLASAPTIVSSIAEADSARSPAPTADYVVVSPQQTSERGNDSLDVRPTSVMSGGTLSASVGSKASMGKFRNFGFGSFRRNKGSSDGGSK